ncbi:ATP-binding cassette domain-containing protein [Mucilaginibacter agri]|uniref:ATP-binding cassette domain-containing protein n=1 Tax=Mucilaginibacter agri TaxID=2695265 RepID=A0A965ZEW7_9SPHI|nr:ATP-binding cassette domain-containing protein [Mucilaginibacter agri]NCD68953.1 ATP-binding cassette domain-containing protein [Mucilaginibacter agri]
MNTPLVDINRISAVIQGQQVLSDISIQINTGGHWAVIGKSGSGKSVLLKAIAGKQGITAGSITNNFKPSADKHTAEPLTSQRVALIESRHHFKNFSNTSDFYYQQRYNSSDSEDAMTVEQYLSAILAHITEDHYWTLEKAVDRLRLTDLYQKQLIKLSNGETKRLRIAAALVKNPSLLLLDQPLTGLDVNSRQYFNTLLQEIADSGITIVMATSPHEIPDMIQTVAVLQDGKLVQTLNPAEIKAHEFEWASSVPDVDEAEIESLLSLTENPTFEWIIKMNNVNVRYGDIQVLHNVNWQVKQGERWALLGHNGAGKSTLLSLAYGDNPQAYANDIILFDKKRGTGESIWDIKRKCGFVSPELYQFFPMDNSCLQVIESGFYDTLGLFRMSEPSRAAIALRWMKVFNIEKYARHLLKNIPASAQRLCLLARALVKNPTLLILDEPCQGMDDQQQQLFKHLVDTICSKSNITLIYVTHYQHEIPNAVDHYIHLKKGEVAQVESISR